MGIPQTRAANELEYMLPNLRDIVNEIREGEVDAYASLYEARRRLSVIVRYLGYGAPSKECKQHRWT